MENRLNCSVYNIEEMGDELSPEHDEYFRGVFESFDTDGNHVMTNEVVSCIS